MSTGRWSLHHHPADADGALVIEAEMVASGKQVGQRRSNRFVPAGVVYALDHQALDDAFVGMPPIALPEPTPLFDDLRREMLLSAQLCRPTDICRIISS